MKRVILVCVEALVSNKEAYDSLCQVTSVNYHGIGVRSLVHL